MRTLALAALVAALVASAPQARAVSLGQIDTFNDGTTDNWTVAASGSPHPAPPHVVGGGAGGAADDYLVLTSVGGFGPGSRLVTLNSTQWTGNYTAAGITGIEMDVRNLGTASLNLRLLFEDATGGPPVNVAATTLGFALPAGSDWTHVVFPIAASQLTATTGNASLALSRATMLRIYDSTGPTFPGPTSTAMLGVDNIRAVSVPEPATWTLVTAGIAAAGALTRRARRTSKRSH
jgi:hypothetical protein